MRQKKNNFKAAKKIFLSLILCTALVLSTTGMVHAQEEPFWTYTGITHLYENEIGGLTRVYIDDVNEDDPFIHVEDYDGAFVLQAKHEIPKELGIYGNFYAGTVYNYLIFGQKNKAEDDSAEVIRVVKYSKNWERLGHASIYGANTTVPFDAGECRCVEAGGMLYVHTCHEMYKSRDGKNHQANMTFIVRVEDMEVTSIRAGVGFENTGYVSHSFDQYILADKEGNVVTLDLGDAFPRAIVLSRYNGMVGRQRLYGVSSAIIQRIAGAIGDNNTKVRIGGFAETDTGYVTAYRYDGGAYLAYTSKNDLTTTSTPFLPPKLGAPTPVLVPRDTSGGYILWKEWTPDGEVLCYASYSADGSIGEMHAVNCVVSTFGLLDSKATYYNGKLVFCICVGEQIPMTLQHCNKKLDFYLLDETGIETISIPTT